MAPNELAARPFTGGQAAGCSLHTVHVKGRFPSQSSSTSQEEGLCRAARDALPTRPQRVAPSCGGPATPASTPTSCPEHASAAVQATAQLPLRAQGEGSRKPPSHPPATCKLHVQSIPQVPQSTVTGNLTGRAMTQTAEKSGLPHRGPGQACAPTGKGARGPEARAAALAWPGAP